MTICPRCMMNELEVPLVRYCSLSRADNETYICNMCGAEEALLDAGLIFLSADVMERDARIPKKGADIDETTRSTDGET